MPTTERELDCTSTVHELIEQHPATRAVFQRLGIDTCCGSAVSVQEAAQRDGLDPNRLCGELRAAVEAEGSPIGYRAIPSD
jgi:regulator of cell morphogenesis and NO signaling